MIECRKLGITLVSATDLPNVRFRGKMKVYAQVSIKGSEAKTTEKTPVDKKGKTNPRWNFPIYYTLSESAVQQPGVVLTFNLYRKRTLRDRYIGEVNIPVKSLFDKGVKVDEPISYEVMGAKKGRLNILYSFGEKFWVEKSLGKTKGKKRTLLMLLAKGALLLLGVTADVFQVDDHFENAG